MKGGSSVIFHSGITEAPSSIMKLGKFFRLIVIEEFRRIM